MSFNAPTVTGYSAFFSGQYARPGNGNEVSYSTMTRYARSSTERIIARAMSTPGAGRFTRRAFRAQAGQNSASAFAMDDPYTRVTAPSPEFLGGLRAVETAYVSPDVGATAVTTTTISRPWMQAVIDRYFNAHPTIANYAVDLSGNGGGGKGGR